jgi:chitodextrinase
MTLLKNFSYAVLFNMRKRALAFGAIFAFILTAGAGVSIATMMQATPTLRLQYRAADPNSPNDNQIKPHFNIVNGGTTTVPLSELTIRYWYTNDGSQPQVYDCDFASRGCSNISASFVTLPTPVTGANTYLQLSFSAGAGSLTPGQQSGEIQARLHSQNWSNYTEGNDYSYDATKTSFADWNRVTLYRNGTLVWGTEPVPQVVDTTPPTAPTNLAVASKTSTSVSLTWTASTDNVGVTGYRIFDGATQVGTSATTSFTATGLAPSSTHTYTVRAVDAATNVSNPSNAVTVTTDPPVVDTTPPTAPTNLAVASKTSTSVSLSWTASTDNVGVTGYRIMEGATQVGTSATTSFTVTGLAPSSTHTYTARAVDAANNVSPDSNAVTVTTDPPVVANLRVQYRAADTNATDNQMKPHLNIVNGGTTAIPMSELTVRYWYTNDGNQPQVYNCDFASRGCSNISASFVSIPAVTGANIYLQLSFSAGAGSLAAGQQSGEIQNRLNNQNFSAYNEANDYSFDPTKTAFADWTRVTLYRNGTLVWGTEPIGGDTTPPTAPTNLAVASKTSTSVSLTWTASTDNVGVTGYRIFDGATQVGTSATTSFTVTGLAPSSTHTYTVRAVDAATNVSNASNAVMVTTDPPVVDTTPPTPPTNLIVTATTSTTVSLSWTASTDNVGVTGYRIFNGSTPAGTSTATTFIAGSLTPNTSFTFTVRAFDAAGNESQPSNAVTAMTQPGGTTNAYTQRFLDLWAELHDSTNGYFSPEGVPYHSRETLICEAPDYGHETTSEAYSYWAWLETMYGNVTGDWTFLSRMFTNMETFIIPTSQDQPTTAGAYKPNSPATFAPEFDLPDQYPTPLNSSVASGQDPIAGELSATYSTPEIYGMHWIIDVDNWYGYGRRGDGTSRPSYINTFQRGPQESVWETVTHPSWENFRFGGGAGRGFLPLFILDSTYSQQWRYTNAPDADARLIQAMYWAKQFADAQGGNATVDGLVAKAAKMGDYLRYSLFDKYFKSMGCTSPSCAPGTGYNSAHYLLSWYYAWGGPIDTAQNWAFRIGSSHNHFGYQNPLAAYALSTVPALRPRSPNAARDWGTSLARQVEFYRWLQSADGGIGGGATNSWAGRYATPPAGVTTFYGMFYDEQPVYHDPPSNTWFGFQVWSMERVAEYYYVTGNANAKVILDKWVNWAMSNTQLPSDGSYQIPSTLAWAGQPSLNWNATTQNWNPADANYNANLRVTVVDRTQDVGVAGAFAKTLIYYSAGTKRWATQHTASQMMAKEILDRIWTLCRDEQGVSILEARSDYQRFDDPIFVPPTFTGVMGSGDPINSSSTFLSIRSKYRDDPEFPKVQSYLNGGPVPTFRYHRFWAQVDVALANAEYGRLFP